MTTQTKRIETGWPSSEAAYLRSKRRPRRLSGEGNRSGFSLLRESRALYGPQSAQVSLFLDSWVQNLLLCCPAGSAPNRALNGRDLCHQLRCLGPSEYPASNRVGRDHPRQFPVNSAVVKPGRRAGVLQPAFLSATSPLIPTISRASASKWSCGGGNCVVL